MERYISRERIDALPGDALKSAVATNWNTFKLSRDLLANLKTELVETLRLTSVVIGSCFALIPISKLLTSGQNGDQPRARSLP